MKVTQRTEALVRELGALAALVDDALLAGASQDARDEWEALRRRWPSAREISRGTVSISDDEIEVMVGKVSRFRSILAAFRHHGLDPRTTRLVRPAFFSQAAWA